MHYFSHQRGAAPAVAFWWLLAAASLGIGCLGAASGAEEGDEPQNTGRLIDPKVIPYDVITLDKTSNSEVVRVRLIPFPNRRIPEKVKLSEKLKVKLLDDESDYEVEWHKIEKIDLFENLVLAEANKLMDEFARLNKEGNPGADAKLDEAYDYFAFLLRGYGFTAGLKPARERYLYFGLGNAFKKEKYDEAQALLEELYSLNPGFRYSETSPTLTDWMGRILDRRLAPFLAKQDFRSAKLLLRRMESRYNLGGQDFIKKWKAELSAIAAKSRDEARAHLAANRFVEAYDACARMLDIWPDVDGAAELSAEITRRYPLVVVGVNHPALSYDARGINNPAARRAGRLLERRLLEFLEMGPEGGNYTCSLGRLNKTTDGLTMTFIVRPPAGATGMNAFSGYDIAKHLLALGDPAAPEYQPSWARMVADIRIHNVMQAEATLRAPHVLPEALLQTNYAPVANLGAPQVQGNGPYYTLSQVADLQRFTRNDKYPFTAAGQPAEVAERFFADPQRALLALQRGEVDVLDHVFPGDIAELKNDPAIKVVPYMAPTSHFLAIRRTHPYLENRTFRRALVYGSNRQVILDQGLLRGSPLPGYRVISAPFPAPENASDARTYGYDENVSPRPFDPKLALILKILGEREVKANFERRHETAPPLAPLVLGHPSDEISKIACASLAKQWKAIKLDVKLKEFPPGVFLDPKGECDLVYVQAAAWEPVVDASRLFAPDGLFPAEMASVNLTLRQLEKARDWSSASRELRGLHRLLHEEVTIIPLWQTYDYFAYRSSVQGIPDKQVTLYQAIERWKIISRSAGK